VRVFDVRDPTTPTLVATFAHGTEAGTPSLAGTWTEKVIVRRVHTPWFRGDLAAVSVQNCRRIPMSGALDRAVFRGFGLYDVTDPANPKRLGFYAAESATQGSHELWLEVSGHRAYVYTAIILSELTTSPALGVPGRPDFRIVDVSDPIHPSEVGAWGAWAELGIAPALMDENGVVRTNFVHSVIGDGERAYLSYWDLGTVILDVAVPETPRFLSRTAFAGPEEGNAHSSWLGKGGRLLIQTDEDVIPSPDPVLETRWGYARFFDIADPTNPVPLATLTLPSTGQFPPPVGYFTVHDPKVRGNLAYLSWYAEGVVIVDISRPANPRLVAQFVPPPAPDRRGFFFPGHAFPHVWGVFVERNFVLAADVNSGLWVFRLK
jgi:hypothetical protein